MVALVMPQLTFGIVNRPPRPAELVFELEHYRHLSMTGSHELVFGTAVLEVGDVVLLEKIYWVCRGLVIIPVQI